MTNDTVYIYDHKSGLETVREMSDAEQAERNADVAQAQASQAADEAAIEQAATARTAAQAKLAALGLTTDDLKALGLGGNE